MSSQFNQLFGRGVKSIKGSLIQNEWKKKVFYLSHQYAGEIKVDDNGVFFSVLNIHLKQDSFQFILESYSILREFHTQSKVQFKIEDENFFIFWNELKLNPTTAEEVFIIQEIYASGTYNFSSKGNKIVIDIGMNVGFASLFFAARNDVSKVYSFEPFPSTFKQAIVNIENNKLQAQKIKCHQYGLGAQKETLNVAYNYENKGQVGVHGTSLIRSEIKQHDPVEIQLHNAKEELLSIINNHKQDRFILKVDCEGSEYGIFQSLKGSEIFNYVDMLFIEWHEKGPEPLLELLNEHGFVSFYQQSVSRKVGMIYASK